MGRALHTGRPAAMSVSRKSDSDADVDEHVERYLFRRSGRRVLWSVGRYAWLYST